MKNLLLFQSKSYKIGIRSDLNVFYLIGPPENEWCALGVKNRSEWWKWSCQRTHDNGAIKCRDFADMLEYLPLSKMDIVRIGIIFNGFAALNKEILTKEISLFGMLTQDDPRERLEKTLNDEGEEFDMFLSWFGEYLIINKPSP